MSPYYDPPTYGIPDRQQAAPAAFCSKCQGELYPGDQVYHLDGKEVCFDCFKDWVLELLNVSPHLLADRLGVDISTL